MLKSMGDMERQAARVGSERANARDLIALKQALHVVPVIKETLAGLNAELLTGLRDGLRELKPLAEQLDRALVDDPPLSLTEGGLIRAGYNKDLDDLRVISSGGKRWIAELQQKERERTGIQSLKVDYNRVFGYYIEVTKPNLHRLEGEYIRKQTMRNAERFITPELKEYEEKILGAEEKIGELEYALFLELREEVAASLGEIQDNARAVAQLDFLTALAELAVLHDYVAPEIDDGSVLEINDGRHPVVEQLLQGEPFVPNDTRLDTRTKQIALITGPNMAGKSTYLRQVGLIVLMAQVGSFVPVRSARIGIVDRIFTRVGASDNLARGESTFLVEMNETANILNNATPNSLVLLDEIGRGTSTFDGLSIAWAVTEYLHNTPGRAAKDPLRHALPRTDRTGFDSRPYRQLQRGHTRTGRSDRFSAQGDARWERPKLRDPGGAHGRTAAQRDRPGPGHPGQPGGRGTSAWGHVRRRRNAAPRKTQGGGRRIPAKPVRAGRPSGRRGHQGTGPGSHDPGRGHERAVPAPAESRRLQREVADSNGK